MKTHPYPVFMHDNFSAGRAQGEMLMIGVSVLHCMLFTACELASAYYITVWWICEEKQNELT